MPCMQVKYCAGMPLVVTTLKLLVSFIREFSSTPLQTLVVYTHKCMRGWMPSVQAKAKTRHISTGDETRTPLVLQ